MCCKSHYTNRYSDPGQRWLLCDGEFDQEYPFIVFVSFRSCGLAVTLLLFGPCPGGSDSWGADGDHAEGHGEVLPSCVV